MFLKIFESQKNISTQNYCHFSKQSFSKKNVILFIISIFFLSISLFSKEMAITFPAVCYFFILIFAPYDKENSLIKKLKKDKTITFYLKVHSFYCKQKLLVGYIIVVTIYLLIRFFFLKNPFQQFIFHGNSIYVNFLTMCKSLVGYLKILILPLRLCADYSPPVSKSIFEISVIISLLLLLFLISLPFFIFKKNKIISFSIIWFFITLLPVSNIVPISIIMAERYIYISSLGFFLFLAYIFQLILKRSKSIFMFSFLLMLLFYYSKSITRINVWRSEIVFWEDTSLCSSRAGKVWANLGYVYLKNNMLSKSKEALLKSLETINNQIINGEIDRYGVTYRSLSNLGIVYSLEGNIDKGILYFKKAIKINPTYAKAHFNLAVSLEKKGSFKEARKEYLIGLKYDPNNLTARENLKRINLILRQLEK